jgi:catechol 2,3-dioxygenase-like lactoylglutathione lyase family enzyme
MEHDQPLAMVCLAYQRRRGELKDAASMKIEHFALNVAEPVGMARWYVKHLGMRIAHGSNEPPYGHFLADGGGAAVRGADGADCGGQVMIEIYHNPADAIPDYAAQAPARMHLAFVSTDPAGDRDRLLAAGAGYVEEVCLPNGGYIVTLRDPWGLAFQLVKRGTPMLP